MTDQGEIDHSKLKAALQVPNLHKELQPEQHEISKKILEAVSKGSSKSTKIENPEEETLNKIHLFVEKLSRVLDRDS